MKGKVAVVLTGHMRSWEQVFPNFKEKVLDRYNPDVFIHTWSDEGWWTPGDKVTETGVFDDSPEINIGAIIQSYQPVEIRVEDWNKSLIDDIPTFNELFEMRGQQYTNFAHKPRNILSMFYKLTAGINLMNDYAAKTGTKYDLVIRMRPDMIIDDLPDFEINKFYTLAHKNHLGEGTGDMFQIGSPFQLTLFSLLPQNIDALYNHTQLLCPHVLSETWINLLQLNWEEFVINKTLMHTPKGAYVEMDKHV
jgi:hypothetical protein